MNDQTQATQELRPSTSIELECRDGTIATLRLPVAGSVPCEEAVLGPVLCGFYECKPAVVRRPAAMFATAEDAQPLVAYLDGLADDLGTANVKKSSARQLAPCYELATGTLWMPGFVRAVELVLLERMECGIESTESVRRRFAGVERVDALCSIVEGRAKRTSPHAARLADLSRYAEMCDALAVLYDGASQVYLIQNMRRARSRAGTPDEQCFVEWAMDHARDRLGTNDGPIYDIHPDHAFFTCHTEVSDMSAIDIPPANSFSPLFDNFARMVDEVFRGASWTHVVDPDDVASSKPVFPPMESVVMVIGYRPSTELLYDAEGQSRSREPEQDLRTLSSDPTTFEQSLCLFARNEPYRVLFCGISDSL